MLRQCIACCCLLSVCLLPQSTRKADVPAGHGEKKTNPDPDSEFKYDLKLPSASAKILVDLLDKHCKSDLETYLVAPANENDVATLTVHGDAAHVRAIAEFVLVLKGEKPTWDEEVRQRKAEFQRAFDAARGIEKRQSR